MRHLLGPLLSALPLALLAACESSDSGSALVAAPAAPRRCAYCGWIESKREVQPVAAGSGATLVYEYTVRMPDGSSGVFRENQPSSWREGQQLIFLKGAGAAD